MSKVKTRKIILVLVAMLAIMGFIAITTSQAFADEGTATFNIKIYPYNENAMDEVTGLQVEVFSGGEDGSGSVVGTVTTDANGEASLQVPAGEADYYISKVSNCPTGMSFTGGLYVTASIKDGDTIGQSGIVHPPFDATETTENHTVFASYSTSDLPSLSGLTGAQEDIEFDRVQNRLLSPNPTMKLYQRGIADNGEFANILQQTIQGDVNGFGVFYNVPSNPVNSVGYETTENTLHHLKEFDLTDELSCAYVPFEYNRVVGADYPFVECVDKNGTLVLKPDEGNTVVVKAKDMVMGVGQNPKLIYSPGDIVATVVQDKNDVRAEINQLVCFGMPVGTYTIEQVAATEGFVPDKTVYTFTISKTSNGYGADVDNVSPVFKPVQISGSVDIATTLPNTEVVIKDADGKTIATATTDKDGNATVEDLVYGDYTAEATKNPEGWEDTTGKVDFAITTQDEVAEVNIVQEEISCDVSFVDWNDNELKTESVTYGNSATAPENPTRTGYTFKGWDKPFDKVTSDMTVKAQYAINEYTVSFKNENGDTLKDETVEYGSGATAPTPPEKEGYTFKEWDKPFDNVTEDLVVKPLYEKNEFTVTFVDNEGNEIKVEKIEYGDPATAPTPPEKEGYTFKGWDKDFDKVTEDMKITAQYEKNKYEVVFVDEEGNELKTEVIEYGDPATAPNPPEKEGYTFKGWDKSFDKVTEDMKITAQYEKNPVTTGSYTVVYQDESGNKITDDKIVEGAVIGSEYTESAIAVDKYKPIKDSETFTFDKDGMTITFKYEKVKHNVTFEDGNGNTIKKEEVIDGEGATAPEPPKKDGYVFLRWDKDFDKITGDMIINPIYEKAKETVKDTPEKTDITPSEPITQKVEKKQKPEKVKDNEVKPQQESNEKTPQTNDNAGMGVWILIMLTAIAIIVTYKATFKKTAKNSK